MFSSHVFTNRRLPSLEAEKISSMVRKSPRCVQIYELNLLTERKHSAIRMISTEELSQRQKFLWAVRCNHFRNGKYCTFWRQAAGQIKSKTLFWRGCREGQVRGALYCPLEEGEGLALFSFAALLVPFSPDSRA